MIKLFAFKNENIVSLSRSKHIRVEAKQKRERASSGMKEFCFCARRDGETQSQQNVMKNEK
jgi:hypothetical protein